MDAKIYDFKFWLSHELGHTKAPQLIEDEGEEFADSFAQALLFDKQSAMSAHKKLLEIKSSSKRCETILNLAKEFTISPITIHKAIDEYVKSCNLESLDLETDIYRYTTHFNKKYKTFGEFHLKDKVPETEEYINFSRDFFGTTFFDALGKFIKAEGKSAKFISNLLNIAQSDAYEIFDLISDPSFGTTKNSR